MSINQENKITIEDATEATLNAVSRSFLSTTGNNQQNKSLLGKFKLIFFNKNKFNFPLNNSKEYHCLYH
jgi:hypothetical protein